MATQGTARPATARQVIAWLETLTISEGPRAGERLRLQPFQRQFVRGLMGHQEAALSIARGNGKTTLAAALAACALAGPLANVRAQTIIVASSFTQAKIAFQHVVWFLRPVFDADRRRWRLIDNSHEARIEDRLSGASVRALGSDPQRAHGLAPTMVIADEPAKWPTNAGPRMHAALVTALGKHAGAKFLSIGTRPEDDRHWFARTLAGGPGIYGQTHAAPAGADDFSLRAIRAANPAFAAMPVLQAELLRERDKARQAGGSDLAMWRALRLNRGTPDASEEPILELDTWLACYEAQLPPRAGPVALGYDLGGAASMTAFVAYWPEAGRLEAHGAFPSEPGLVARGHADGVDDLYVRMARRGELRTYPGKGTVAGRFLAARARDLDGQDVIGAVADRYKQADAEQALAEAGVRWPMTWRAAGAGKDGSADVRAFQAEVLEGHVRSVPSVLMESAIAGSRIRYEHGNPALDKRRQKGRIDALQAAVLAVGLGRRWRLPVVEDESPLARYYAAGGKVEIVGV